MGGYAPPGLDGEGPFAPIKASHPKDEHWLGRRLTSSKRGPMLKRSMAGPCASLAWGATSAVMRRVASLSMSLSSSSDTPCRGIDSTSRRSKGGVRCEERARRRNLRQRSHEPAALPPCLCPSEGHQSPPAGSGLRCRFCYARAGCWVVDSSIAEKAYGTAGRGCHLRVVFVAAGCCLHIGHVIPAGAASHGSAWTSAHHAGL